MAVGAAGIVFCKNSHELTRMTRIIGWFSFMVVGAAGVVFYKNSHELTGMARIIGWFSFMAVGCWSVKSPPLLTEMGRRR
jgi:hypothetical protein